MVTLSASKIDINRADLNEIKLLPITEQQAEDIYEYRYYISFFKSIYDLKNIESIDQKTLNELKSLIIVSHYDDRDASAERRDEIYYLIERLGSNEGLQEGMSDVWEDFLMTPRNINKLIFSEILNFPNVSAIDVTSILKRLARKDTISNYRDLRYTPGISYYGAKNLGKYVYFKEKNSNSKYTEYDNKYYSTARKLYKRPSPIGEVSCTPYVWVGKLTDYGLINSEKRFFFDYQIKYKDSPYADDAKEMYQESMIRYGSNADSDSPTEKKQSYWGFFNMESDRAEVMNKFRFRFKNEVKAGLLFDSEKGDDFANFSFADSKYFVGYENDSNLSGRNNFKIYTGNYRATFGEGLVMENTDYYSPRKTGYGFNKRITGIIGDVSRTQEYSLKGLALDLKTDKFNAVFFLSNDDKDAVIYDSNQNGKIDDDDDMLSYITLTSRFSNEELKEAEIFFNSYSGNTNNVSIAPRLDAFNEQIIGGHFEYSPIIGTHVGFTGYEAIYDRDFVVPNGDELKELLIYDYYYYDKWKTTDNEVAAMYFTKSDTLFDRNYRRVVGFDWRTVINNTSFQGEYAEMEVRGKNLKIGDDPKALLISSYTQFDNMYLLSMYRDYDLDFDNPYQRSFAESQRYDDTVFEKLKYGLRNTLLGDIYNNSAQPSAEKGFYFEMRYQFHRMWTLTKAYLDIWERKSDARKGIRFEGKLEFKPIHQLRFKLRHKQQIKRYNDDLNRSKSQADEIELKCLTYLSNFDKIQLGYIYTRVSQPPYLSILSDPAQPDGADMAQANTLSNGDMLYVDYTHNFNKNLKIIGSFSVWYADGASFWDFEDVELDFEQTDKGFKSWFNIHSRISNNLYLSLKYKYKQFKTREIEFRDYNEIPEEGEYYFRTVERKENIIRLQLDWKF